MDRPFIELENAAIPSRDDPAAMLMEGVDWVIAEHEFWVVAGLPGCGKSQLLETAAGLLRPAQGGHRLFGQPTSALPPGEFAALRRRVGFVFGSGGRLFNQLTVAQNVGLPLCYHRECGQEVIGERVERLLEQSGLTSSANRLPGRLNHSCRQRVALVRALALEPEVLVLDNPLSGLDARETIWWLEFLAQLSRGHPIMDGRRVTLAVGTDGLRPWLGLGHQFALIKDSRWLPLGGRAALAACPEPLVREFLADSPSPG